MLPDAIHDADDHGDYLLDVIQWRKQWHSTC